MAFLQKNKNNNLSKVKKNLHKKTFLSSFLMQFSLIINLLNPMRKHVSTKSLNNENFLTSTLIDTPIGPLLAISDKNTLFLLEFHDRSNLKFQIEQLCKKTRSIITPGWTAPLHSIKEELFQYFNLKKMQFQTPIKMIGSPFQMQVWQELQKIPMHKTASYTQIATSIQKPSACRAVAQANSANHLAIIIPCHRVIYHDGSLGGYAGGISRKEWLLAHEKKSLILSKSNT